MNHALSHRNFFTKLTSDIYRRFGRMDAFHNNYHGLDEIIEFYTKLQKEFPSLCRIVPSIGQTWEGRDIPVLVVTGSRNGTSGPEKWAFYMQATLHAREWITVGALMYFLEYLLRSYATDPTVKKILDTVELHLTPVANPDGYVYSWHGDRLWRKNRRPPSSGTQYYGVDLNRNFDALWGTASYSSPNSSFYHGPSVESEPETQAIVRYFIRLSNRLAALDIHSYSQTIVRPWGIYVPPHPDEAWMRGK